MYNNHNILNGPTPTVPFCPNFLDSAPAPAPAPAPAHEFLTFLTVLTFLK